MNESGGRTSPPSLDQHAAEGRTSTHEFPMTFDQIETFLASYSTGCGVVAACRDAEATTADLRLDLKVNRDFRTRFKDARDALREEAEKVIYDAASTGKSVQAAAIYLKLEHDRKAAKAIAKAIGPSVREREFNLRLLDDDQWNTYVSLHEKLESGELLDAGEAMTYTQLLGVTMSDRAAVPAIGGPGRQILPFDGGDDE